MHHGSIDDVTHDITGSLIDLPSDSSPLHPMPSSTANHTAAEAQQLDNDYGQADTTFKNVNIDDAHNTSYEAHGPKLKITDQDPYEGHPHIETDRKKA